jgi:phosphoenolpyruvate carboxykinase (ATP)
VICHLQNDMLIRPREEELLNFGEPDFTIYNAGQFPANRFTKGMSSTTSVEINFRRMKMVMLGTEYAGEMKKGVFSVMVSHLGSSSLFTRMIQTCPIPLQHYLQPVKFGQLSLHSSATVGTEKGDVSLFFGLSGTAKTTLRAPALVHPRLHGNRSGESSKGRFVNVDDTAKSSAKLALFLSSFTTERE